MNHLRPRKKGLPPRRMRYVQPSNLGSFFIPMGVESSLHPVYHPPINILDRRLASSYLRLILKSVKTASLSAFFFNILIPGTSPPLSASAQTSRIRLWLRCNDRLVNTFKLKEVIPREVFGAWCLVQVVVRCREVLVLSRWYRAARPSAHDQHFARLICPDF